MSTKGYNGRELIIQIDGVAVAAVQSKTVSRSKSEVDVTNDDSSGWRTLLSDPGTKSIDVSINGVATVDNYNELLTKWNGDVMQNVTIVHPNGDMETAADGFFLSSLEQSGEHDGHVAFTAQLMSSGAVTVTPAP